MRKLLLLSVLSFIVSLNALGNGSPYTSVGGGGNWNLGATWGNIGNTPGVHYPAAGDVANITSAVIIPGGFDALALDVTINDNASSSLVVTGTLTFTGVVTTGTASAGVLTINGTMTVEQGATMVASSTNSFILNGTYRHNYTTTAGAIYRPTWNLGSTMEFIGYTSNTGTPTGLNQNFRNIVWNCANQGNNIYFTTAGGTVFNTTVNGNLTIQNTNGNRFGFNHATSKTLTISGNLSVVSTSKFNMNFGAGNTTINLKADLSIGSADGILTQSAGVSTLRFNGAGGAVIQHVTNASVLSTNIAFEILNPAVVEIAAGNFISTPFDFTLFAGATLRVGTTDGIMQGSSGGAVRADGNKIYEDDANIIYMGSVNQDLGDEWSGALLGFAVNLEIATTSGASVTNNNSNLTSVVGLLTLTSGSLNIGNNNTLTISGDFAGAGGSFIGAGTPTAGTSGLTFTGSGSFTGTLNFAGNQILKTLTISRSGTFVLGTPLTVAAATGALLRFTSNGSLQFSGQTLTINSNINQTSTGGLSSPTSASTNLVIGGSGTLASMGVCSGCGTMELNNLTLNRSSATYTLAAAIRINGTLDLSQGTLSHSSGLTMVTGSILSKSAGTTFSGSAPTASSSYNLSYIGNQTTSLELPSSSTALNDLSIAGDVLMDKTITINGNVNIASGTLDASTFNITMAGASFTVGGGAFTMNSASTFTFTRSGTTTLSGSSLQFPNFTIFSTSTTVAAPASFSVSGTWDNNGFFTPGSGTVIFNGPSGTQFIDANAQPFFNVDMAGGGIKSLQGPLDVNGSLDIHSTLNTGANQPINVAGSWNIFGGATFVANSGTVTFDGDAQTINAAGQSFYDLTLSKPGLSPSATKTLAALITIGGKLTIGANITFDVSPTNYGITIAGDWENNGTFNPRSGTVTFSSISAIIGTGPWAFNNVTHTGALTAPSGTMTVSGNWSGASFPNSFTANGGTLHFNGATQSISPGGQTFNNVTISGSNTKALAGIADINGNLLLNGGTFNASTFQINLAGNFDASGGGIFIGTGADFNFDGASQTVTSAGEVFNNVTFSGSGTKGLADAFDADGFVTILNVALSAGSSIHVAGNWSTAGTGSFTSTGTTTFDGAGQIISSNGSSFGAVTIAGTSTKTLADALDANGNLTVTSTLDVTTSNYAINVGGNWNTSGGTFTARTGTVTLDGAAQNITLGAANSFSSLTIAGSGTKAQQDNLALSASLTINSGVLSAGTNRITLAGNWTNNATNGFLAGTGVNGFVGFTGSSLQTISGSAVTDFSDIQVTNAASPTAVTVESNQNLHGVLSLNTNSVFDADGSTNAVFKLMSSGDNPTIDASIFTLPSGASVTGNVTVQRYMSIEGSNNTRIYRYISSAVQNAPVSQIQSFIPVTGSFGGASSCSGCGTTPSMFVYDETVLTDTDLSGTADFNDGYTAYPVVDNTSILTPGRGHAVFVRGNIAPVSSAGSALWEVRGPINAGNVTPVTLPVSYTPTGGILPGNTANDGWNLVGNPYPSTIDWLGGGWTKTFINDAIYMLDNGLGSPAYATFVGGSGTNGGSRYIPSGQAFFVKGGGGGTPALTASETVKASGTQTTFFRVASVENQLRVTLKQGARKDEIIVKFTPNATTGFDSKWDAHKFRNPIGMFNLASVGSDNTTKFAINALKAVNVKTTVKLDVSDAPAGNYGLDFSEYETFTDTGMKIYLKDEFLGTTTDIKLNPSYQFQITTDAATFGGGRFSIVFEETKITGLEETLQQRITIYPNPTSGIVNVAVQSEKEVSARVVSLMGVTLSEKTLEGTTIKKGTFNLEEQADGMYILVVQDGTEVYQTRIIKKR